MKNSKESISFDDLKKHADKCIPTVISFFQSFLVPESDSYLLFEGSYLRKKVVFQKQFDNYPDSNKEEELSNFEKLLKFLKKHSIVKNYEIRQMSVNDVKEYFQHNNSSEALDVMLEMVEAKEIEYWSFSINLTNNTEKLELLQRFYDMYVVDRKFETFSKEKQLSLVSNYVLGKIKKFDKLEIVLDLYDEVDAEFLSLIDAKYIRIMFCLRELEGLDFLHIKHVSYDDKVFPFRVFIDLSDRQYLRLREYVEISMNDSGFKSMGMSMFDIETSYLEIRGSRLKIKKFAGEYHLLKTLYKDSASMSREWQFSEIAELYDAVTPPKDKFFHNKSEQIKKKVAISTGLTDFLITTTHTVKINEKYITALD